MKFLHTGDLHLDAAFCRSGESEAAQRREQQREVLKRIFDTAKQEACEMILIAGDLFDTVFVTPETKKLCISLFEDFGAPIVISPGNHDPYVDGGFYKSEELPENVYVFNSSELQYYDFPKLDVTVAGYAFTGAALKKNPLSDTSPVRHSCRIKLLCAHTEVDSPLSYYAPIAVSELARQGYAYAALGHIHKYTELKHNIRYCGFAEGRGFDEPGDGGVLIVSTDGVSDTVIERKIISQIRYVHRELSFEGVATADELYARASGAVRACAQDGRCMLRLELTGATSEDAVEGIARVMSEDFEGVEQLEIINSLLVLPDKEALERDTTLRGEFYRSMMTSLYSDDASERALALKALYIGLAAIDGRDFTARSEHENS